MDEKTLMKKNHHLQATDFHSGLKNNDDSGKTDKTGKGMEKA